MMDQAQQKQNKKKNDSLGEQENEQTRENTVQESSTRRKRKRRRKIRRIILIILAVILVLLLALAAAVLLMANQGRKAVLTNKEDVVISAPEINDMDVVLEDNGQTVVYNGETYRYNENVTSILFMGVDREEMNDGEDVIGNSGQADCIFLLVWNFDSGDISLLSISREAMVDVNNYDVDGNLYSVEHQQLCLAYAYGDGQESSCENVVTSVSRLFYGIPIQSYVAINLSAIGELNDAIGGVEVTVLDDSGLEYTSFVPGTTVLLTGDQAEQYVRSRDVEKLDSNSARMARQKQYILAYIQKALQMTREDLTLPITLYQMLSQDNNMVTNIDLSRATYLASQLLNVNFSEENMMNVPGEVVMGDEYAEYIVDDQALYEMILDVFYTKVDG